MRKNFKWLLALVAMVASVNLMAGVTDLSESLDLTTKKASANAYSTSTVYGDWTIVNGANNNGSWAYFKMGGKEATLETNNPCYIYYSAASGVSSQVDSITVSIAAGSLSKANMSVNSWGVYVYSDKAMKTQIDYVAGGTITKNAATFGFKPTEGVTWAAGSYYKVSWDLANTTSTNGVVCVDKVTLHSISDTPDPVLQSIAISGTPKTAYETGESFDVTGLTVTGTYDIGDPQDLTIDAEWEITPATFTSTSQTSVSVTAKVGEKSDTKNYNVTVTEHVVTPGTYEIALNKDLYGIATAGGVAAEQSVKVHDITVVSGCSSSASSKTYYDAAHIRYYVDSYLKLSVPTGYEITSVVFTADGTWNGSITSTPDTYEANTKTWTGRSQNVDFAFAAQNRAASIKVTYAEKKVVSSIAVKTAPTKTTYYVGDDFDPAGLVITASYTDESTEDIAYTEDNKDAFSFSGFNSGAEATGQVITVTYAEKSATFTINIETERTLNSITVASNPSKMVYEVGEALDLTGLVVNGIFSKGDPEPVEYTADPEDGSTLDATGTTTVTLTSVDNTELTTSFDVTVNAIEGDRITLAETGVTGTSYVAWTSSYTAPSGAVYTGVNAGSNNTIQLRSDATDSKPASGIISTTSGGLLQKVKVVWNTNTANDRELEVFGSNTAYTAVADLVDNTKKGTSLGTIKKGTSTELVVSGEYAYVGVRSKSGAMYLDNVTFIWSAPKVLESIAVKTAPTVVNYAAGEFFSPAGLVITATYDDQSTADIAYEGNEDKFTFSPALDAALATTNEKVTITYGGKSCNQAITVKNIELTSIVVSGNLSKTEYTEGDDFDFTGLVATGYYSDETNKGITDQVVWSIDPATLTAGQTSVKVIATLGEKSGSKDYDITVAAAPLEVTWDASQQGYSNQQAVTEATFNAIISAEFEGGKYYTSGTAVRVYSGKTFAIHAVDGYKITSIVIGFGTGEDSNAITADCGTYSNGTWTGSAKDVKFTVGGTSGNRRLKTFTVAYAVAGASAATPTITPSTEAEVYWEPITVTLATTTEDAAIYYTTNGDAPTAASTLYEAPFQVSATTTVKAIAVKEGLDNSEVASKTFSFGKEFDNIAACFADETLQNGDVVKISNVSAVITGFAGSGKTVYFDGGSFYVNATYPQTYAIGGTLSGSNLQFTYMNYEPKQLRLASWETLTYTAPGSPTGVNNVKANAKATKAIVNGQIVIVRDNKTYNVLGF